MYTRTEEKRALANEISTNLLKNVIITALMNFLRANHCRQKTERSQCIVDRAKAFILQGPGHSLPR